MRDLRRKRARRYADVPANLIDPRTRAKVARILNKPYSHKVNDEYNHDDVRAALRRHHGLKCVYCETESIAGATFRIDHYRPKKGIKELKNTRPKHPGYYWLSYEWTNLMQSCQLCNGPKSNHFPLTDELSRMWPGSKIQLATTKFTDPLGRYLKGEMRMLLNPELDPVEDHFSFKHNGTIHSDSIEGNASIIIYDLDRDDLILRRKKKVDRYFRQLIDILDEFRSRRESKAAKVDLKAQLRQLCRNLSKEGNDQEEYSNLGKTMFRNFQEFYSSRVPIRYRKLVEDEYKAYTKKR